MAPLPLLVALFAGGPALAQSSDPLADVVPDLRARAADAFAVAQPSTTPKLMSLAALEAAFTGPLADLEAAGCSVDFATDAMIGGQYGATFSGSDQGGGLTDTVLQRSARHIELRDTRGVRYGALLGTYRAGRLFAYGDAPGTFVLKVQGTRD